MKKGDAEATLQRKEKESSCADWMFSFLGVERERRKKTSVSDVYTQGTHLKNSAGRRREEGGKGIMKTVLFLRTPREAPENGCYDL